MGPPELPGGNSPHPPTPRRQPRRFNGAAGITRRKPTLVSAHDAARRSSFNGAAGITRRKPCWSSGRSGAASPASMGPPELPGGNRRRPRPANCDGRRLQWGRRNYPAETAPHRAGPCPSAPPLQWGRRNYPAETAPRATLRNQLLPASMGPPELPGGNYVSAVRSFKSNETLLQWGRRNYPAETLIGTMAGWSQQSLQWGRRNYPAETAEDGGTVDLPFLDASMGPPELPGGNRRHLVAAAETLHASMGPPELPGGN